MSLTQTYEWYKRLKTAQIRLKTTYVSDDHPRQKTNRSKRVRDVFRSNRRLTVRKVADEVGISEASRYFD